MAYATVADFILEYDSRRIAQYASDTGAPVASGDLETNDVVLKALEKGAAAILLACRFADRYSAADLEAIATAGAETIIGLNCDLAFGFLLSRRGYDADQIARIAPQWPAAQQLLEQLRLGSRVFDTSSAPEAGMAVDTPKLGANGCSFVNLAGRMYGPLAVGATSNCCPSMPSGGGGCCGS